MIMDKSITVMLRYTLMNLYLKSHMFKSRFYFHIFLLFFLQRNHLLAVPWLVKNAISVSTLCFLQCVLVILLFTSHDPGAVFGAIVIVIVVICKYCANFCLFAFFSYFESTSDNVNILYQQHSTHTHGYRFTRCIIICAEVTQNING